MGISADLIMVEPATEEQLKQQIKDGSEETTIWEISSTYFKEEIQKELKELLNSEYVLTKELIHIGDIKNFKKNILETYEKDEGFLNFKNNYQKIEEKTLTKIINFLTITENLREEEILKNEFLYINLNY